MAKTNVKDISAFLKSNIQDSETKFIDVSERFRGADGKPIKWEIKMVNADQERRIEKKCTIEKRDRRSGSITQIRDDNEYISSIAAYAVVFPDLMDSELQRDWGAKGAVDLLRKMLSPGELVRLSRAVLTLSGLGDDALDGDVEFEDGEPISDIEADAEYAKN